MTHPATIEIELQDGIATIDVEKPSDVALLEIEGPQVPPDSIEVTVPDTPETIEISVPATPEVIEIETPGLQGPQGPAGPEGPEPPEYKSYIAAEDVRLHHVVVGQPDGKAKELDINNQAHGLSIVGIARQAADTGVTFNVQNSGYMTEAGWSWTPGEPIYAGVEGLLTQTVPTGAFVVIVALALSETELNVFLHSPIYL